MSAPRRPLSLGERVRVRAFLEITHYRGEANRLRSTRSARLIRRALEFPLLREGRQDEGELARPNLDCSAAGPSVKQSV
jgi:hypothetical protein